MKVLFIYSLDNILPTRTPLRSWSNMQYGISCISSLLKSHGHNTSLLVLASNFPKKSSSLLETCLEEFGPSIICFTAVYSQYPFVTKIARLVKERWPDKYLVIGGVHATLQPEETIHGPFDAACIGEGEYPLLELCLQLEAGQLPHGIANLWFKSPNGDVEQNWSRDFIQDLDMLPLPDYGMWKPWIAEQDDDVMTVFGGRGCPYDCTYCSNHALRKVARGKYVRMRSPAHILAEVMFLYTNYPHRKVFLEIETLDCNKNWVIELCDKLAGFNSSIPDPLCYESNYRITPHTIDESLFSALNKANFSTLHVGLESGCERIRREVLKRNYTNDDFLRVVSLARQHGLKIFVYNMIGLPGESLGDHRETVQLNRQCQPDGHHTGIFFPYPGTELYRSCRENGLIDGQSAVGMERRQPVIDLPNFSKSQVRRAYTWFNYHVYRGYKPLHELLAQAALVRIDSSPIMKFVLRKVIQSLPSAFRCKNPS